MNISGSLTAKSIAIVHRTPNGGVQVDPATGKVTYRPVNGFGRVDEFRYTVRDR